MPAKTANKGKISLTPVKLLSQLDFARYVSDSYLQSAPVLLMDNAPGRHSLIAFGESLKKTRITYYVELQSKLNSMTYRISEGKEHLILSDNPVSQDEVHSMRIIPIEVQAQKFSFTAKPSVSVIKAENALSLARQIALKSSMAESGTEKVYSFIKDGERFIGSFEVIPDESVQTFVYAKMDSTKVFNFFRYNYTADTIEETDTLNSSSDVYVRVINLAEPFPFALE